MDKGTKRKVGLCKIHVLRVCLAWCEVTNESAPYRGILLFIINFVDVDECSSSETNECDPNALCTNMEGSYVCRCKKGFTGNGSACTGMYIHKQSVNFTNLYFSFEGGALA